MDVFPNEMLKWETTPGLIVVPAQVVSGDSPIINKIAFNKIDLWLVLTTTFSPTHDVHTPLWTFLDEGRGYWWMRGWFEFRMNGCERRSGGSG